MSAEVLFEGHDGRSCGEHRTTGSRAWCYDDSEWCYGRVPCAGCMAGYPSWEYDPPATSGYLTVMRHEEPVHRTQQVYSSTGGPAIQIDLDDKDRLLGVEVIW